MGVVPNLMWGWIQVFLVFLDCSRELLMLAELVVFLFSNNLLFIGGIFSFLCDNSESFCRLLYFLFLLMDGGNVRDVDGGSEGSFCFFSLDFLRW